MTTCPYCPVQLPPRRRKHCGGDECRRAYNAERMRGFYAAKKAELGGVNYYARFTERIERREQLGGGTMSDPRPARQRHPEGYRKHDVARAARKRGATVEVFSPLEVYERDEWLCGICGEGVDRTLRYPDLMSASLDHVIPLSAVPPGPHSKANTRLAHLRCNIKRGNRQ